MSERKIELAAEITRTLMDLNVEASRSLTSFKPADLTYYGAIIYGLCGFVLFGFSKTSLFQSLLAPSALGMIIGLGLVVADQFSVRSKLNRFCESLDS